MAGGTKLSRLQKKVALTDDTIFYIVDPNEPTNLKSQGIEKIDLERSLNIGGQTGSRVVSGGMVWVSGLTYESVNLVYSINGNQFAIADGTQVTLDAAPTTGTDKRIDLIYGDDTGTLGISKGTAGDPPTANTLTEYQLQLTLVLLDTNATEPDGVTIRYAYNENLGQPTEFDATENTGGVRIDLASATDPITSTVSIETLAPLEEADNVTLTHATATTKEAFQSLKYKIKLKASWGNDYINIGLYNGATLVAYLANNSSFLDTTNITDVQTITLFNNDFNWNPTGTLQFDTIKFIARIRGSSSLEYILDDVEINEDENAVQPVIITGSDVTLDTTNFDNNLDNTITDVQKLADAVDELTVAAGSVDFVSNVDQDTILGRVSGGNGNSEELTAAQVRSLINVADGATANNGTVTSVAVSGSDGIEVDSGSPITTSGTIALGLNAGTTKTFLKDRLLENASVTGSFDLDYSLYELWNLTLTGATTFTESNLEEKTILIRVTGDFALTFPANWSTDITGAYDGTVSNIIVVQYIKSGVYKVQITQPD